MALTVVDDITSAAIATTSSQKEVLAQTTSETALLRPDHLSPEVRGKRRRPKFSLNGSMFKRHPILKFSATGPLDRERSPYKWWCRVCKVDNEPRKLGADLSLQVRFPSDQGTPNSDGGSGDVSV